MLDVTFAPFPKAGPALPSSGALALLLAEGAAQDAPVAAGLAAADATTAGAVSRAIAADEFKARRGKTCTILAPGGGLSRVVAVGLGKIADLTELFAEEAGGHAASALAREPEASIAAPGLTPVQAVAVALGAVLRSYRFDRYRTTEKAEDRPRMAKLTLLVDEPAAAKLGWSHMRPVAEGVFLSRDLVSEPPNVLNPAEMAERCTRLESLGLKVDVLGPKELTRLGFGALLGVAQGSANEPRVVVMHWHGASGEKGGKGGKGKGHARKADRPKPLAFIGKGVTFDTGGISIKPAAGMEDMKWDMAGAGAVVGLMAALAGRHARVDAVGVVGLVENMPGAAAQRPGDVITTLSGQTVEVINTDAEGRLVLADLLTYCQRTFDPRLMVDLATLTGAIIIGLGHEHGGLFANDDGLADRLLTAGATTGEKLWRMPLGEAYDRQIKSDIADMKNVGGRPGGSITAAQFIQRFVNGRPWAHLDIAGMAWSTKDAACVPKGATAFGVRLLDRLVATDYET
jgi:leucyl aminopeptidase